MRPFDVRHADPRPQARAAAIRSRTELDPLTRAQARQMTPAERIQVVFELSRFASRLRSAPR